MKIAVRCIFTRPITPNFLIINLAEIVWARFLWGDTNTRIDIVRTYLPRDHPPIREVSFLPLDDLTKRDKTLLVINLFEQ